MNKLQELIEAFDLIYVFFHQWPDMDALGSANGLRYFVEDHYPTKKIIVVEDETLTIEPNSLAVILDCGNPERVLNQGFHNCSKSIVIDHHPKTESYGDYDFTNVKAAATCELLSDMLWEISSINYDSAYWLYSGLLTDTINFTTSNTTANTLLVGSKLLQHDIDVVKLQEKLFGKNIDEFRFETYLKSQAIYGDKLISVKVTEQMAKDNNVTMDFAKSRVGCFTSIKGVKIVVLFYEDVKTGKYKASIRSKEVVVNTTANKYGGGGHAHASGVGNLDDNLMAELIKDLNSLLI